MSAGQNTQYWDLAHMLHLPHLPHVAGILLAPTQIAACTDLAQDTAVHPGPGLLARLGNLLDCLRDIPRDTPLDAAVDVAPRARGLGTIFGQVHEALDHQLVGD